VTHTVLIGLGILIVILTVVAIFGLLPPLRIVPDNTHFDFTRFRRISFPISALLSIVAITLFFTHGLNFGIDFKGGTLMEVRAKSGAADIASMRSSLAGLGLGDIRLPNSPAATRRNRKPSRRCADRLAIPSNTGVSRWSDPVFRASY
jgi:preprotein translocase subunit SecF